MLLCTTSDDQLFYFIFICSHYSKNSSLFMSNLISMRIKFMDMKRHIQCFSILMLVGRESSEVIIYKHECSYIRKGGR